MTLFPEPVDVGGYGGMTANERLATAKTIDQFYSAASHADRATMIALLRAVEISDSDAEAITDAMLANPTKFRISTVGNSN